MSEKRRPGVQTLPRGYAEVRVPPGRSAAFTAQSGNALCWGKAGEGTAASERNQNTNGGDAGSSVLGYPLGLEHVANDAQTMYAYVATGETRKRSLESGAIAGAKDIY